MTFSRAAAIAAATCVLLMAFTGSALAAPPANDNFADAQQLIAGAPAFGGNVDATIEGGEPSPGGWTLHHSTWFSFTPTQNGAFTLTVCANFQTNVLVMKGSSLESLAIASSSPFSGAQGTTPNSCGIGSYLVTIPGVQVKAGDELKIHIGSAYDGSTGGFAVNPSFVSAPANDDFETRTELRSRVSQTATNAASTVEVDEANNPYANHRTVWFNYRGIAVATADVEVCADFPVNVVSYEGSSVGDLTITKYAQGLSTGGCGGSRYHVLLEDVPTYNTPDGGQPTVKIQVGGAYSDADTGNFDIEIRQNGVPANDDMPYAHILDQWGAGTYTEYGDNTFADYEDGVWPEAFPGQGKTVLYFAWLNNGAGEFTFDTCGSSIDTVTQAYPFMGTGISDMHADGGCPTGDGDVLPSTFVTGDGSAAIFQVGSKNDGPGGPLVVHYTWDPQPGNNSFSGAQTINDGDALSGTNKGANAEGPEPNNATGGKYRSVWYRYTAPSNGFVDFDTCQADFDTVVTAWTGPDLASLSQLNGGAAADDGCEDGDGSKLESQPLHSGQTVYFAVDGADSAARGNFTAALDFNPAPSNDDFANAQEITGSSASLTWGNEFATLEAGEPKTNLEAGRTIWYTWTAPSDGFLTLSTCNDIPFGSSVGLYTGSALASLSSEASAYDNCSSQNGARISSQPVEEGVTYSIQLGSEMEGYFGTAVPLELSFDSTPANDNLADAIDLGSNDPVEYFDDNRYATNESGEPTVGGFLRPASVWYKWTAPFTTVAHIDTCSTPTDYYGYLSVFTSGVSSPAPNQLSLAASDTGSCTGDAENMGMLELSVTKDTTYWIAVSSFSPAPNGTDFTLRIRTEPKNAVVPGIGAEKMVGETITAGSGLWLGSGPFELDYQWLRCDAEGDNCVEISGADDNQYEIQAADDGSKLRARVTANGQVGAASVQTAASALIDDDSDNDGVPDDTDLCDDAPQGSGKTNGCPIEVIVADSQASISGTVQVGQTLTGNYSFSAVDVDPTVGAITYTFDWLRCDAPDDCTQIDGADGSTYTLVAADLGKTIKFRVDADNLDAYEYSISEPTATVVAAPVPPAPPAVPDPLNLGSIKLPKKASVKGLVKAKGKFTIKSIQIPCPAGGADCKISLTFAAKVKKKTKKLGSSSFTVPAGQTRPLTGKFSSAGVKLIKANKKLKVTIALKGSGGGAGKATFKEFTVTK